MGRSLAGPSRNRSYLLHWSGAADLPGERPPGPPAAPQETPFRSRPCSRRSRDGPEPCLDLRVATTLISPCRITTAGRSPMKYSRRCNTGYWPGLAVVPLGNRDSLCWSLGLVVHGAISI